MLERSVPICDAVSMCADLRKLSGGALAPVAEAVRAAPSDGPIACRPEGHPEALRAPTTNNVLPRGSLFFYLCINL